jgi:hypothetical protein
MIEYIQGINSDRIIINGTEYCFGYNCSHTIKHEVYAQENYNNAIKYGWKSIYYNLKPFIGRILNEVEPNWYEEEWVGRNVFMGRALTSKELTQIKDNIKKEFEKI